MTKTTAAARALMKVADPLPTELAASDSAIRQQEFAEFDAVRRADQGVDAGRMFRIIDLIGTPSSERHSHPLRSTPWIAAAAAVLVALVAALAFSAIITTSRSSQIPPADHAPATTATPSLRPPEQSAAAAAQRAAEAAEQARACASDVANALQVMISAYTHAGGTVQGAMHRLQSLHPSDTLQYSRDAAAFYDWIARGGPSGKFTVGSVVGHACIQ